MQEIHERLFHIFLAHTKAENDSIQNPALALATLVSNADAIGNAAFQLVVLSGVYKERPQQKVDITEGAMALFWALDKAGRSQLGSPEEWQVFQEALDQLEKAARVPYEPDAEITDENEARLIIYAHIAACRALLLKRRDGYSDDVRQTLEDAWRALCQLGGTAGDLTGDLTSDYLVFTSDYEGSPPRDVIRSTLVVAAIIQVELFKLRRLDGKYEQALHFFAEALGNATTAMYATLGGQPADPSALEHKEYVPRLDVSHQEIVDVFENLRASQKSHDWRQIARDCAAIAEYSEDAGFTWSTIEYTNDGGQIIKEHPESVVDGAGQKWGWDAFWHLARGWAEARLEPSELLEEMKRAEDEQAQKRLKAYFFDPDSWAALPPRAQQSLVNADILWFAGKFARVEAALNELRVATDEILYCSLWGPLCDWMDKGKLRYPDFQKMRNDLADNNKEPSVAHFERMLKTSAFREYLRSVSLSNEQSNLLFVELPKALKELLPKRGSAEHHIGRIWNREEVAPVFAKFLGIGCVGILPRLVEIQKRIAPSKQIKPLKAS